mmetsp:Transcript_13227/g.11312  ORF Transcript_13227/g.11312 Transcript_13227/m.11312 type:complete len:121 (-) Transcript_13227:270-632(-)
MVYSAKLTSSFETVEAKIKKIVNSLATCDKVFSYLDVPNKITPNEGGITKDEVRGEIEFKNVEFSYPKKPDVKIFKSLNLKVKQGESVALVGSSGSGKSTLVNLAHRLYDADKGDILIDG